VFPGFPQIYKAACFFSASFGKLDNYLTQAANFQPKHPPTTSKLFPQQPLNCFVWASMAAIDGAEKTTPMDDKGFAAFAADRPLDGAR
jgi:hypothetical protein